MSQFPNSPSPTAKLEHGHQADQIRDRLTRQQQPSYLRDFVYGAIDGAVTTFAVVSGVAGAGLSPGIVIVLGTANLIGDGFSMAAGNFLGTRAEEQLRDRARRMEERHIDQVPDGEREEIRQLFGPRGFVGEDLERVVTVITSDRDLWIETMLREEHGLPLMNRSPVRSALATLLAFLVVGFVPLFPFVMNLTGFPLPGNAYQVSGLLTGVAFFGVGAAKSRFVEQSWYWSGIETLIVGGVAAALAYACGVVLAGWV